MNILIAGGTSGIGRSIVRRFTKDNSLFFIGRSIEKVSKLKKDALLKGALNVGIIEFDLGQKIDKLLPQIANLDIDLFINIASSTSRLRDSDVNPKDQLYHTNVELTNPILLVEFLLNNKIQIGGKLKIIFITSVLAKIKSPNRSIYSCYKLLQENYLKSLSEVYNNSLDLLIVTVGTEMDKEQESKKSIDLAGKIWEANLRGKNYVFYGISGRILVLIYSLSPILYNLIILIKRRIKPLNSASLLVG